MKDLKFPKIILLFLITFFLKICLLHPEPLVVKSSNKFGIELYKKTRAKLKNSDNICFSPFGISTAMTIPHYGATKKTKNQINKTLEFPTRIQNLYLKHSQILDQLNKVPGLNIANKLFVQDKYGFNEDFKKELERYYNNSIVLVNFEKKEEISSKINNQIKKDLCNKISRVKGLAQFNPQKGLALFSSIFFNLSWKYKFNKQATKKLVFFGDNDRNNEEEFYGYKKFNVYMMFTRNKFKYKHAENYYSLELPLEHLNLSMFILLPHEDVDISEFENKLDHKNFEKWFSNLGKTMIDLHLPIFEIKTTQKLGSLFSEMGIVDAFNQDDALFQGINSSHTLAIDQIFHNVILNVNEQGKESPPQNIEPARSDEEIFNASWPFLYFIIDKKSKAILLMGKLARTRLNAYYCTI